ncbi:MAG: RecX family transcriptional regulator [Bacilli bacterium]
MKILKFKKVSKAKYKVYLDNGDVISLYEDVIVNNNLLLTKEITEELLESLPNQNLSVYVYNIALNYISIRIRSTKEVKEYLKRKKIDESLIDETIDKLIKNGYINDFNFTKAFVNDCMVLTSYGPYKIKNLLLKSGILIEVVDEVIGEIDELIIREKLYNLIDKQIKIRKNSSGKMLKVKLINYFVGLGFDREMILEELSKFKLKSDIIYLQKEYNKLYNKYKNKYDIEKLQYFIIQKLYSKGYTAEEISKISAEN